MTTLDGGIIIKKGGGGTSPAPMPSAPIAENDVTFYDYDGKVLHAYTKEEFLALTAMPPLPTREGLICQEWNWDLADAQAYVSKYGMQDIGATYITDNGETRLYLRISRTLLDIKLDIQQDVANGVTIDWGDGSAVETIDGTGEVSATHNYPSMGNYVIRMMPADDCNLVLGHDDHVLGGDRDRTAYIQKVELGKNMTSISNYALTYMECPDGLTMPNGITYIGDDTAETSHIKHLTFPRSVTSSGYYVAMSAFALESVSIPKNMPLSGAFSYCSSLKKLFLSETTTEIESYEFCDCYSLKNLIIPESVTSIGSNFCESSESLGGVVIPNGITVISKDWFKNCYLLSYLDFSSHTSIPTATSAMKAHNHWFKVIVPDNLYDAWIAATNWSAIADQIIKKSDWDALNA